MTTLDRDTTAKPMQNMNPDVYGFIRIFKSKIPFSIKQLWHSWSERARGSRHWRTRSAVYLRRRGEPSAGLRCRRRKTWLNWLIKAADVARLRRSGAVGPWARARTADVSSNQSPAHDVADN